MVYCKDCFHVSVGLALDGKNIYKCVNPNNFREDPVTGEEYFLKEPGQLRSDDSLCGSSGKWFSSKN